MRNRKSFRWIWLPGIVTGGGGVLLLLVFLFWGMRTIGELGLPLILTGIGVILSGGAWLFLHDIRQDRTAAVPWRKEGHSGAFFLEFGDWKIPSPSYSEVETALKNLLPESDMFVRLTSRELADGVRFMRVSIPSGPSGNEGKKNPYLLELQMGDGDAVPPQRYSCDSLEDILSVFQEYYQNKRLNSGVLRKFIRQRE